MGFVKAHPKKPLGMGTPPEAFLFLHKALSMRLRPLRRSGKKFHNSLGAALWILTWLVIVVRLYLAATWGRIPAVAIGSRNCRHRRLGFPFFGIFSRSASLYSTDPCGIYREALFERHPGSSQYHGNFSLQNGSHHPFSVIPLFVLMRAPHRPAH